jgi:hypothetical protein
VVNVSSYHVSVWPMPLVNWVGVTGVYSMCGYGWWIWYRIIYVYIYTYIYIYVYIYICIYIYVYTVCISNLSLSLSLSLYLYLSIYLWMGESESTKLWPGAPTAFFLVGAGSQWFQCVYCILIVCRFIMVQPYSTISFLDETNIGADETFIFTSRLGQSKTFPETRKPFFV